jgi:hypothetical protein
MDNFDIFPMHRGPAPERGRSAERALAPGPQRAGAFPGRRDTGRARQRCSGRNTLTNKVEKENLIPSSGGKKEGKNHRK